MSSPQPSQQTEHIVVYGIPIANQEAAVLTRRVLNISIAMALIAITSFILSIISGDFAGFGFIIAISIPLCGYYGAKNRSHNLLTWFWSCNLACVILFVISAIFTLGFLLPALDCLCDPECREDNSLNDDANADSIEATCSNEANLRTAYILSVVSGALAAALQCAGFIYGRKLAHHAYFQLVPAVSGDFVPTAQPVSAPGQGGQPQQHGQHQGAQYANHNAQQGYTADPYAQPGGQQAAGGYPGQGGGYSPAAYPSHQQPGKGGYPVQ